MFKYNLGIMETRGRILREARLDSGLTQAELAIRAGTSQSAVNRYEKERQTPTKRTFERLLSACSAKRKPSDLLKEKRCDVLELARSAGASYVKVFGSVSRGSDDTDSDLDLLVDVPLNLGLFELTELRLRFEDLIGTHVDLVTPQGIRPELRDIILTEAKPL